MAKNVRVCHLGRKGKVNKEKCSVLPKSSKNVLIQLPMSFYKKM